MMITTRGIHHITITVANVQKSKKFYSEVCGMKTLVDEPAFVGLTDGDFSLWLSAARDPQPKGAPYHRNNIGLDHWAFKVASIEELERIQQHLKSLNISMEDGGITDDDFGGRGIFTQDPDGMKVEFHLLTA